VRLSPPGSVVEWLFWVVAVFSEMVVEAEEALAVWHGVL